jgi:Virulence-associated protein E
MTFTIYPRFALLNQKQPPVLISKSFDFLTHVPREDEKQNSPFFICGILDNGRKKENVRLIDGIIIESENYDLEKARQCPFFRMVRKSYSGNGIHCYVAIEEFFYENNDADYTYIWQNVVDAIKLFLPDFAHDPVTHNVNRLWFFGGDGVETHWVKPEAFRMSHFFLEFLAYYREQTLRHDSRRIALFSTLENTKFTYDQKRKFVEQMAKWGLFDGAKWRYQEKLVEYENKTEPTSQKKNADKVTPTVEKPKATVEKPKATAKTDAATVNKRKQKNAGIAKLETIRELYKSEGGFWCAIRDRYMWKTSRPEFNLRVLAAGVTNPHRIIDLLADARAEAEVINPILKILEVEPSHEYRKKNIGIFLGKLVFETDYEQELILRMLRRMVVYFKLGKMNKIAPMIIGTTNIGKSTLIRDMFSPFADFYAEVNEKWQGTKDDKITLVNNVFVHVDEIYDSAHGSYLKSILSSDFLTYRAPFSRDEQTRRRIANVICSCEHFHFTENSTRFVPMTLIYNDFDIKVNWVEFWQELYHAEEIEVELSPKDWQIIFDKQNIVLPIAQQAIEFFRVDETSRLSSREAFALVLTIFPHLKMGGFQVALARRFKQKRDGQQRFYNIAYIGTSNLFNQDEVTPMST